jgi:hypothetical protein
MRFLNRKVSLSVAVLTTLALAFVLALAPGAALSAVSAAPTGNPTPHCFVPILHRGTCAIVSGCDVLSHGSRSLLCDRV